MHKKRRDEIMADSRQIEMLAHLLSHARHAVFFGGAGVSCESGIPDFRSQDGLYHQQWAYPPETILSHSFFLRRTEEFFRFYREKMLFPKATPNPAHLALAELEKRGMLSCVITQNIDGLHQAAGSRRVIELHGSVHRNFCMKCHKSFLLDNIIFQPGIPRCSCGGIIKPDVVLYEEQLPPSAIEDALDEIARADLLIIGGTSLSVYPAAGFVADYTGKLVMINLSPTPLDRRADLCIASPIGETMAAVMKLLHSEEN